MTERKQEKASGKRHAALMLSMPMLTGGLMMVRTAEGDAADSGRQITAYTEVTKWGQMPLRFTVRGQHLPENIGAERFTITGEAAG